MFIISKIISDRENYFTQNKYNKLQKIIAKNRCFFAQNKCNSANMGSSTVQLHGVELIVCYTYELIIEIFNLRHVHF